MNSTTKSLLLATMLVGTALLLAPASATHTTYCGSPIVYDPLTGDPVRTCTTYYSSGDCTVSYGHVDGPVNVNYPWRNYYCNGNSYTCYAGTLYVDTNPARVGEC